MKFLINNKFPVLFHNVLFVPSLSTNLFSVKEFLRYQGTLLFGHNNLMTIAFPSFIFDAHIKDEITFTTSPTSLNPLFSSIDAPIHPHTSPLYISKRIFVQIFGKAYKTHKKFTKPITPNPVLPSNPSNKLDSIIKQKHNVNIDNNSNSTLTTTSLTTDSSNPSITSNESDIITPTPTTNSTISSTDEIPTNTASSDDTNTTTNTIPPQEPVPDKTHTPFTKLPDWLHHDAKITLKLKRDDPFFKGILLKNTDDLFLFHVGRSRKHGVKHPLLHQKLLDLYNQGFILRGHGHLVRSLDFFSSTSKSPKNSPSFRPPLPTEHKPLSSWSSDVSYTMEQLKKGFRFRNIENILPQIKETTQSNFSLTTKDKEKILDLGECATIPQSKRNTTPLPLPHSFGDVMHMDIIYGTVTAIEGYRYALFIVDRATQTRFILPENTQNRPPSHSSTIL